jgi:hypothetical protein
MVLNDLIETEFLSDIKTISKESGVAEIPLILAKYVIEHRKVGKELSKLEHQLEVTFNERYKYYKEEYDEIILKDREVSLYAKADEDYLKLKEKVDELASYKEALEKAIATIKETHWVHKTKIDYEKLYAVDK